MKSITLKFGIILLTVLFAGFSLSAQEEKKEESKMIVKVLKEGKTVLDTIYTMDEDFDQEKIEAMIEDLEGDSKMINIFKTGGEDKVFFTYSNDMDIDSLSKGKLKWIEEDGKAMTFTDEYHFEEGEDGEVMKYFIKKGSEGEKESNSEMIIVKKIGEGCEEGEIETTVEVIMGGKEGLHEFHTKEGNVMIMSTDKAHKPHKVHKGNVFIYGDEDEGEDVIIDIKKDGDNVWSTKDKNDVMFFSKEKKNQISLNSKGGGLYRLEFESDELEPVQIEVFDGEGNRMFKKKVKNFYGRFLKDVELSGNETGLYTVRVLQGEKEIIGEFEYK